MKSHFLGENETGMMLSIKWSNPYTNPPSGKAKILWACSVPWPCSFDESKLFPESPLGYGHFYAFFDLKPRKTWSPERKAKERLRRMKQRFFKKDPLFADQFIQAKINSKPDYYDPVAIAKADKRHKAIMMEHDKKYMAEFIGDCITIERDGADFAIVAPMATTAGCVAGCPECIWGGKFPAKDYCEGYEPLTSQRSEVRNQRSDK